MSARPPHVVTTHRTVEKEPFTRVVVPGHGAVRRAPLPLGPSVEILVDDQDGAELAAAHLTVPAGGGMPEHTHGESAALLVMLDGELRIRGGGREATLVPGTLVYVARGERIGLANGSGRPATLLAVFAPADFIRTPTRWPAVTDRTNQPT